MKLTVIGNNGPYPAAGGACSSYLLEAGGSNILIDLGSGSFSKLQEHIAPNDIDVVILSHLHFDHISDMLVLKYFPVSCKGGRKPLLFMPETPEDRQLLISDERFYTMFIHDGLVCNIAGAKISFFPVKHPIETYGVRIEYKNKVFVYTSDISDAGALGEYAKNADLLLIDAGLTSRDRKEDSYHLSVREACEAGAAAKRTVLTHLSPKYTALELIDEVSGNAELSEIGKEYDI